MVHQTSIYIIVMKPWQTPVNKAPSKRGKKKRNKEREDSKSQPEGQKPKVGHKGAKEQIIFQIPTILFLAPNGYLTYWEHLATWQEQLTWW
jgi:hypothetical protein